VKAKQPMPEAMLERVAELFRALSEPSRLRLMQALFGGEHSVGELVEASGLTQANVSKHLGVLHQAGWVTREKRGLQVVYALADDRAAELCDLMCNRVQQQMVAAAAAAGIAPARKRS
jgi:DNA-binding transcriptional ArsR family regulator